MENTYKSIPFWSWNNKLEKEELVKQIHDMKKAHFGGFIMHARSGLSTPYLSEEWFDCIKASVEAAKELKMDAWIYDENGWPSGFVGGKLLEKQENLSHFITYKTNNFFDENALANYILKDNNLIYTEKDLGKQNYHSVYDNINNSNTDVLNSEVIRQFIEETHEEYYKRFAEEFGKTIKGFFIDEPQYFRADTPYSLILPNVFKEKYNINLKENIGLLFVDCNNCYSFRYKYWKTLQELFLNNFIKQVYDWCTSHNVLLTGHGCEESCLYTQMWCCAGVMPMYEYLHLPGIDWLGRDIGTELGAKQLGSYASQMGVKHTLTETFGCCGWDTTPKELKIIGDFQYVNGINKMCQHLYDYSIEGHAKRDYPEHFSEHNSWYSSIDKFNDYFDELGYKLSNSEEIVDVGIIHPMTSCYLTYKRNADYNSVKNLEDSFQNLIEKFGQANIPHHFIDETLLLKYGKVNGNKLVVGNKEYGVIVIPYLLNLEKNTAKVLKEYIVNGGKICIEGELPKFLEGEEFNFDFIKENITFKELKNQQKYKIESTNKLIRSTLKKDDLGEFLFVCNLSSEECCVKINDNCYDFNQYESKIIYAKDIKEKQIFKSKKIKLNSKFNIEEIVKNYLTIDKLKYSIDGVNYSEKRYFYDIFENLIHDKQNSKIYLKYNFTVKNISQNINLICEDMHIINAKVNKTLINLKKERKLDKKFLSADIKNFVNLGENEVVFEVDFYQREYVYNILFGEGITESLINCLYYDSVIESIYLEGDFAVFAEKIETKENVVLADEFYIDKQPSIINVFKIIESGFLFFRGNIKLSQEIIIDDINSFLLLDGRYMTAKIYLNDNFIEELIFSNQADLSKFAKIGKNKLTIELTNSNRNLFGPHHFIIDEPRAVSPYNFNFAGSWIKNKNDSFKQNYSFVKFGIIK